MGGVTEQDHASVHPVVDGFTVIHRPPVVGPQVADAALDALVAVGEGLFEFFGAAPVLDAPAVAGRLEDGDLVEYLTAMQRVLDEMTVRADVADHILDVLINRHLAVRGGSAIG